MPNLTSRCNRVYAAYYRRARGRFEKAQQETDCGRLTRTIRSEKAEDLTRWNSESQVIDCRQGAKPTSESARVDNWRLYHLTPPCNSRSLPATHAGFDLPESRIVLARGAKRLSLARRTDCRKNIMAAIGSAVRAATQQGNAPQQASSVSKTKSYPFKRGKWRPRGRRLRYSQGRCDMKQPLR
jgi:hypothetical protein